MSVRTMLGKGDLRLSSYAKPFDCRRCDEPVWVTFDAILDAADEVIEAARKLAAKSVSRRRPAKR